MCKHLTKGVEHFKEHQQSIDLCCEGLQAVKASTKSSLCKTHGTALMTLVPHHRAANLNGGTGSSSGSCITLLHQLCMLAASLIEQVLCLAEPLLSSSRLVTGTQPCPLSAAPHLLHLNRWCKIAGSPKQHAVSHQVA